jgi:hypothetical protein
VLRVDPVIADAGVVSDATGAGLPQLGEHLRRIGGEGAATIEPIRKFLDQPQIVIDACWWRQGSASPDHPTFQVGHRALLLCPLGGGQHDVGQCGGFGQEDVGDHQQVQRT